MAFDRKGTPDTSVQVSSDVITVTLMLGRATVGSTVSVMVYSSRVRGISLVDRPCKAARQWNVKLNFKHATQSKTLRQYDHDAYCNALILTGSLQSVLELVEGPS